MEAAVFFIFKVVVKPRAPHMLESTLPPND